MGSPESSVIMKKIEFFWKNRFFNETIDFFVKKLLLEDKIDFSMKKIEFLSFPRLSHL